MSPTPKMHSCAWYISHASSPPAQERKNPSNATVAKAHDRRRQQEEEDIFSDGQGHQDPSHGDPEGP